jgi:tetratricopeptide (TPR) repeat protein
MYSSLTRRLTGLAVFLAALAFTVSTFAQTGGVTGKCIGEDGKPLGGYTIQLDRQEVKWTSHIKTKQNGEYQYIGLTEGRYKVTLLDPSGRQIYSITRRIAYGDPTVVDFDMTKEKSNYYKQQLSNPETAKKIEEQQAEQKQYVGLKQIFNEAGVLYEQQHYAESAAMYEKALPLSKDKNVPIVLARMADAYANAAKQQQDRDARIQDQQKAVDDYQKAMQLTPNDPVLHNNLGSVYAEMGKVADAQREFQKAADLNPSGASGYYYNLGVVLVNQGKMEEASTALKKCTDLDPRNANAFYWYGMALLGKAAYKPDGTVVPVPGTVEAFQTYLKLQPNGQWAQAAAASLEQIQGKVPTEYKKAKKKG